MKKNPKNGFVLAETLVVTVFLMTIFSMIYYYFYPLIGEYEQREVYDDVDDKYSAYWIKRIIEDSEYEVSASSTYPEMRAKAANFDKYGYFRFECSDINSADEKKQMCKTFVNDLEVNGCDHNGDGCDIFVTGYQIGVPPASSALTDFKQVVARNEKTGANRAIIRAEENCASDNRDTCISQFVSNCMADVSNTEATCNELARKKVFNTGFRDYVQLLPNYKTPSDNGAKYRIIVGFKHIENSNYSSYATIEVR